MTQFAADNFTGSANSDLSGRTSSSGHTWTRHPSYTGQLRLNAGGNAVTTGNSSTDLCTIGATPTNADYSVAVTATTLASGVFGPVGRADTTANTFYHFRRSGTAYQLFKFVAGTATQIGTGGTPTAGDVLELDLNGTDITGKVNGTSLLTAADSAITAAGRAGIRGGSATGWVADDFSADEATAAAELSPDNAAHGHTADSPTLASQQTLAPADALHGHVAGEPGLASQQTVSPADGQHAHTADSPTLSTGATVLPADASHGHVADSPSLASQQTLAPANGTHGHTADSATLSTGAAVAPADAVHGHVAGEPPLASFQILAPADALHGHAATDAILLPAGVLIPADAMHGHTADSATLIMDEIADPWPATRPLTQTSARRAATPDVRRSQPWNGD